MGGAQPKKVRIVHDGGPACMAKVCIDGEQVTNVTGVEILMNANDNGPVSVKLTMVDVALDITGDLAETQTVSVHDPNAARAALTEDGLRTSLLRESLRTRPGRV